MRKAALLPSGQDVGWARAVPCVPSEIWMCLCGSEWFASLFVTPTVSFNPESLLDWTFRVLLSHFTLRGKKKTCVTCSRYRESCGSADTLQGTERWCSTWAQQALGHPSMSELLHRHHVSCSQLHSRGLMLLSCTWICESSVQLLDCRACLTLVGFTVCPTLSAYVMGQLWSTYNLKLWGAYVLWLINMHELIAIKTKNWVRWINTKDVHLLSYTKQYFLVLFSLGFNFLFV